MIVKGIKTLFPGLALAGSVLLFSCGDNSGRQLRCYMAQNGASEEKVDDVIRATKNEDYYKEAAARQSVLDSMAFRDLFNTTYLADDSNAVAEFNKIASKYKIQNVVSRGNDNEGAAWKEFSKALDKEGVGADIYDEARTDFPKYSPKHAGFGIIQKWQFFGDKFLYRKFFEDHHLMSSDSYTKFNKKFFDVADNIDPNNIYSR